MMHILVTGGAGFIGSNLTLALQRRYPEAQIVVLDDFSNANFENLNGFQGEVVCADMSEPGWMVSLANYSFDMIYHLASNTDTRVSDQSLMMRQNVEAFRLLLEFASESSIPIVYASSAAVYGRKEGMMAESNPSEPANVYAFSKSIMDNMARSSSEERGGEWKIVGVRYFNVYGPGEGHKGVPASMIYHLSQQMCEGKVPRIFEFGEQKRDFVYVEDVVEGTILAMEKSKQSGIYNLGYGEARSFNQLVEVLNQSLGLDYEPEYFKNPFAFYQNYTQADLSHSKQELGYQPRYSLEEGVSTYMRWLYPERF